MVDLVRRNTLMALSALPLVAGIGAAFSFTAQAQQSPVSSKSLVAFFTRTGNTRVIANQIRRATSSDMFEIVPATAYPEDYEETVAQARRETETGFEPALAATIDAIASYRSAPDRKAHPWRLRRRQQPFGGCRTCTHKRASSTGS